MTSWSPTLPDLVGFFGVALLIGAYAALQIGRLRQENPWYSGLNALAAALITVSLIFSFNAASFVIEVFWFAISLYGLWRSLKARRLRRSGQKAGGEA
ncbi:CBU_0592 family membrane protein [Parvularcula dongshanensis]|uniref:CBU-0592-like domain-containing protein n=1 Tax=Parvularcula dongshanensis TaxID=1173995 RepID=A0A840I0Q9_9PROT|nr:hypothetical protein [Parvularcula dongshanensis]MBB4657690.1 hypothetical protein [Parvularcula dongshanensis]